MPVAGKGPRQGRSPILRSGASAVGGRANHLMQTGTSHARLTVAGAGFLQLARTRHASLSLSRLLFSPATTFEDPLFGL
jgi:hypothetical protein